jgi:phage antirepressor YoqD-like protein
MEAIHIHSLEQLPAGFNFLLKRIDEIEAAINNKPTQQPTASAPADTLRTRTETAKILRVTLATLNDYTKTGKIVANRIGNRVLYKDSDIQNALSKVKTSNIVA